MYSNIGHKLRTVAKVVGMIGFVIVGIGLLVMLMATGYRLAVGLVPGLICITVGLLLYVSTFPLYAFGQLVDDVNYIRNSKVINNNDIFSVKRQYIQSNEVAATDENCKDEEEYSDSEYSAKEAIYDAKLERIESEAREKEKKLKFILLLFIIGIAVLILITNIS